MNAMMAVRLAVSTVVGTALVGCSAQPPALSDSAFIRSGRSTTLVKRLPPAPAAPVLASDQKRVVSPPATTRPISASSKAAISSTQPYDDGQYMTLGGVVAEVNGTPIFANQVLAPLNKMLAAKAKEMSFADFHDFAKAAIARQRRELISNEVEFAAAERLLSKQEKHAAEMLSIQYRQKLVTDAGGSEELAARRARAKGLTFDELMKQHYRQVMRDIFYQRRIFPHIQVTANDMRAFYDKNVNTLYSKTDEAQYRIIKIDPSRLSGDNPRARALSKIAAIRKKAVAGDDFAALARAENSDPYLKAHGGDPGGWMQKGAYRVDTVDAAVWKLQPGQVSDVIDTGDAFYIVKVEAKKPGKTRPFDDPAVQDDIMARLRQAQFSALRDKVRAELENEAVIRDDDSLMQPAIDMALQKYPMWASK